MIISAVTADELAAYVGGTVDDYVSSCLDAAVAMVAGSLVDGKGNTVTVPDAILDRAVLEVGSELYHRRNAPNGVAQFATMDAPPIRIARDPMVAARPILAPYLAGGFA